MNKQETPVLFYGSSSIRMWSTMRRDFPERPVMNLGFGGSTMGACAWFFKDIIQETSSRAMVLYVGDNDLAAGRHPEEVVNQFRILQHDWAQLKGDQPLVVLSVKPSPIREHLMKSIRFTNRWFERIANDTPNTHYLDICSPMLNRFGEPDETLFLPDRLHMNSRGYKIWTKLVNEKLNEVL